MISIQMQKEIRAYLVEDYVVKIVISPVVFVFFGLAESCLTAASFLLRGLVRSLIA